MNELVLWAFLATLGTWFITSLGAATVLLFNNANQKIMNITLGFASGVMIAASFWSLLQPAIERAESVSKIAPCYVATIGFIGGAIFMWTTDKTVSILGEKIKRKRAEKNDKLKRIYMLIMSITLHNIPEGMAVGVAFGALNGDSYTTEQLIGAISVAIGIGLQNFPEGAAVSVPLRREGFSKKKSFLFGQASAIVEPIAGIIGAMLVVYVEAILPYALSFAAGAMILVAVHELIPECQSGNTRHGYHATMGIIIGFATMMLLDVMLG